MHGELVMSVCPNDSTEKLWIDFDEIWCGHYAVGDYLKNILYNFLQSVIPAWWANKLVMWGQH
jgi:hypothetical protein